MADKIYRLVNSKFLQFLSHKDVTHWTRSWISRLTLNRYLYYFMCGWLQCRPAAALHFPQIGIYKGKVCWYVHTHGFIHLNFFVRGTFLNLSVHQVLVWNLCTLLYMRPLMTIRKYWNLNMNTMVLWTARLVTRFGKYDKRILSLGISLASCWRNDMKMPKPQDPFVSSNLKPALF